MLISNDRNNRFHKSFDATFIMTSKYFKKSSISPVDAPRDRAEPVGSVVFYSPTENPNPLISDLGASCMPINSPSVCLKILIYDHQGLNRSVGHDFSLNRSQSRYELPIFSKMLIVKIRRIVWSLTDSVAGRRFSCSSAIRKRTWSIMAPGLKWPGFTELKTSMKLQYMFLLIFKYHL